MPTMGDASDDPIEISLRERGEINQHRNPSYFPSRASQSPHQTPNTLPLPITGKQNSRYASTPIKGPSMTPGKHDTKFGAVAREEEPAQQTNTDGQTSLTRFSPPKFLSKRPIRRPELRRIVPLADTTIYEMEQRGEFPKRFYLTPRCVVWDLAEIEEWIEERRRSSLDDAAGRTCGPDVRQRKTRPVRQ